MKKMKFVVLALNLWLVYALNKINQSFENPNTPKLRITNGLPVALKEFPFQVGIDFKKDKGIFFCEGSIISESYILTAAHCAFK